MEQEVKARILELEKEQEEDSILEMKTATQKKIDYLIQLQEAMGWYRW